MGFDSGANWNPRADAAYTIFEGARALYKTLQVTGELYGLSEVVAELGRRFAMPPRKKPAPAPEASSSGTTPAPSAS